MKKQALALIFANGINFLVSFIMSPFLARHLSYHDNGTYGQVNLINGYVVLLFGLGITSVINLLLIEYKEKEREIFVNNFWIQILVSIILVGSYLAFSGKINILFKNPELHKYLLLYVPSTISTLFVSLYNFYFLFYKKNVLLAITTVIFNIARILSVYYAVNYLHSLTYLFTFWNVINISNLLMCLFIFRKKQFPLTLPHIPTIKYIVKTSYPYLGLSIIGYTFLYGDGVIVSNMLGVKDFAIYRNGALELPFISKLYASITVVFLPQITEFVKNKEYGKVMQIKRRISSSVAAMIYPVVFFCIFNGNTFVSLYLGEKYIESGLIFSIYNISVLFRINNYTDILIAERKPVKIILPTLISLIINLVLVILLIKAVGLVGGAVAYALGIGLYCLFQIIISTKAIKVNIFDYFDVKKILFISLICGICSLISHFIISPNYTSFILIGLIYTIVVYMTILKLNLIETGLIPSKIRMIFTKLGLIKQ